MKVNRPREKISILTQEPCRICRYLVHLQAINLSSTTASNSLTQTDTNRHTQTDYQSPTSSGVGGWGRCSGGPAFSRGCGGLDGSSGCCKGIWGSYKTPRRTEMPPRDGDRWRNKDEKRKIRSQKTRGGRENIRKIQVSRAHLTKKQETFTTCH